MFCAPVNCVRLIYLTLPIIVCLFTSLLAATESSTFRYNKIDSNNNTESRYSMLVQHPDEYVAIHQKRCLQDRNFASCLKYRMSKMIWKLATNRLGFFAQQYDRAARNINKRRVRLIQLVEPFQLNVFEETRSFTNEIEPIGMWKFLQRSLDTFGRMHALEINLGANSGVQVVNAEDEGRGIIQKKKYKWLIILPLIILMKIAHLKMKVVTLLLGVLGLNTLILGGTAWIIHYLKFKTLCKIHPHYVQQHTHSYDYDVADYSQFVGSSHPYAVYGAPVSHHYETEGVDISHRKEWPASDKVYRGPSYLDTISKRLQL